MTNLTKFNIILHNDKPASYMQLHACLQSLRITCRIGYKFNSENFYSYCIHIDIAQNFGNQNFSGSVHA